MTTPSRFTVPLEQLDLVHVDAEQQVTTRSASGAPPDSGGWGGALPASYRDGTASGGGGELGDGD